MVNYNDLRIIVASCVEGSEEGLDFRVNMFKLTEKLKPLGLIPLFYKNDFNAKIVTPEDVPLLTEFFKKDNVTWFDDHKSFINIILVREEDIDDELSVLLQEILRARLEERPKPLHKRNIRNVCDKKPPKCHCLERVDLIKVLTTITGNYPCYTALIAKSLGKDCIHLNIRFRANIVLMNKESNNGESEKEPEPETPITPPSDPENPKGEDSDNENIDEIIDETY